MISFKKIADRDRNCLIGQKLFIHSSQPRARIRKLPVYDHMIYVVKIDILSGDMEIGLFAFYSEHYFYCMFIEKPCIFSKPVQLTMKV